MRVEQHDGIVGMFRLALSSVSHHQTECHLIIHSVTSSYIVLHVSSSAVVCEPEEEEEEKEEV